VGSALERISEDSEISEAIFTILENQRLLESKARITLVPRGNGILAPLLASRDLPEGKSADAVIPGDPAQPRRSSRAHGAHGPG
jgi:hypothetical protein